MCLLLLSLLLLTEWMVAEDHLFEVEPHFSSCLQEWGNSFYFMASKAGSLNQGFCCPLPPWSLVLGDRVNLFVNMFSGTSLLNSQF